MVSREPDDIVFSFLAFSSQCYSYPDTYLFDAIALRNGIVAITAHPNKGPTIKLTKGDWSKLILGEKLFASLNKGLKAFDQAVGRFSCRI